MRASLMLPLLFAGWDLAGTGEPEEPDPGRGIEKALQLARIGRYPEAESTLEIVGAALPSSGSPVLKARYRLALATLYSGLASIDGAYAVDARETFEDARRTVEGSTDPQAQAVRVASILGTCALDLRAVKQPRARDRGFPPSRKLSEEALAKASEALAWAEKLGLRELRTQAEAILAEISAENGWLTSAESHARKVITQAEPLGDRDPRWRAHLVLARVFGARGDAEKAVEEYRASIRIVEAMRSEAASDDGDGGFMQTRVEPYRRLVLELVGLGQHDEGLWVADMARARHGDPEPKAGAKELVAGIQSWLDPSASLLVYFDCGDAVVVWVVRKDSLEARVLETDPQSLRSLARRFHRSRGSRRELAHDLYRALLLPVREQLGKGMLLVAPTGWLRRIPFEALWDGLTYLVRHFPVAYLSDIGAVPRSADGRARAGSLLALVNPDTDYDGDGDPDRPRLIFAEAEVDRFASRLKNAAVFRGPAATEEKWAELCPGKDYLHLACHGEYKGFRPWQSCLFLARSGGGDGVLEAREIRSGNLRGARLVTLSGCDTGLAQAHLGDDLAGLPRAFLVAGASSLVASLWKVEDRSTAALMARFYVNLLDGFPRSEAVALRAAKLEMLEDRGLASPACWAAFVLILGGDGPAETSAGAVGLGGEPCS